MLPLGLLALLGIGLWASGALGRFDQGHLLTEQGTLRSFIADHPLTSRLAYTGLLAAAIATGVPGTIVIVFAGGLFFGTLQGTALSSIALVAGSLVLYAASRHAFGAGSRQPPELAQRMRRKYAKAPVRHTFALRFVPIVPLGAMTIALAWLRCPLWLFTVATWLGGTVSIAIESAIGAGVAHTLGRGAPITSATLLNSRLLVPLAAFAVITLLPMLVKAVRSRRQG